MTVPAGVPYEVVTPDVCLGLHERDQGAARVTGQAWFGHGEAFLLLVPSVVARMERNVVINAAHPDFARIEVGLETPVWWIHAAPGISWLGSKGEAPSRDVRPTHALRACS